jgi:hypothetical protein
MALFKQDKARSNNAHICVMCCFVVMCSSENAWAQSFSDLKRWDVAGSIGWLAGDKSDIAEEWNDWYDTFAGSVDVGRYWTPHLKTEAGFLFTTEGSVYSHLQVPLPRQPFPAFVSREHHFRLAALNLGLAYQFLDNQWVHPFVTAGVQLGWEHERRATQQVIPGVDPRGPVIPPLIDRTEASEFEARPFASGGAKFYVNERGFVRTDLTVAWHKGGIGQVAWRTGIGVDF